MWGVIQVRRVATALVLPMALAGCLNAASGDVKPEGSVAVLQKATQEDALVRSMVAKTLAQTPLVKGGLLVGRYRTKDSTIAGPHLHQDPLTKEWGLFYCVKAGMNATFRPEFRALAMVLKTPSGWSVQSMGERLGIGCATSPRPFPELDAQTNKLADQEGAAP